MGFKYRLQQLFMSKEQIIYLEVLFFACYIDATFASTFTTYQIGLGSRFYALLMATSCTTGVIHAFVAADIRKKRWVFKHFWLIDVYETLFFTLVSVCFFTYYFTHNLNPLVDKVPVLQIMFVWSLFHRIINSLISIIIPGIGDVFEQSLYHNQIDYQNHSNAERLMASIGALLGALSCWLVGDFFIHRPYLIFTLILCDWIYLWSRLQFYYKPENFAIIKRHFAADSGPKYREFLRKISKK